MNIHDHVGLWDSSPNSLGTVIECVLDRLERHYKRWADAGQLSGTFADSVFRKIWADQETTGEKALEMLTKVGSAEPKLDVRSYPAGFWLTLVSCAYCVQAIRAVKDGSLVSASWHSMQASRFEGMVFGIDTGVEVGILLPGDILKRNARKGAMSRHAENHAMKALVFDWYSENGANFRSMDKAAEAIAGKLVPVSFRTARVWLAEFKKVRLASRA